MTEQKRTWDGAQSYCTDLVLDGYDDWTLPSIEQLSTIVNFMAYEPALSTAVLDGQSSYYWSASPYASESPEHGTQFHRWRGESLW